MSLTGERDVEQGEPQVPPLGLKSSVGMTKSKVGMTRLKADDDAAEAAPPQSTHQEGLSTEHYGVAPAELLSCCVTVRTLESRSPLPRPIRFNSTAQRGSSRMES